MPACAARARRAVPDRVWDSDPELRREAEAERQKARDEGNSMDPAPLTRGVSLSDFYAYMPQHNYMFAPSREPWPAASLDARLPWIPVFEADGTPKLNKKGKPLEIPPSAWLDQNKPVEQMTWAPGEPMIIENRLISEGGWIKRQGVSCFNLYRPPLLFQAMPRKPGAGSITSGKSTPTMPSTSSIGSRTGCSVRRTRSITHWCSAACKASERTPCSSPSSARSGRGMSPNPRRCN
jgi:hypothetical protein